MKDRFAIVITDLVYKKVPLCNIKDMKYKYLEVEAKNPFFTDDKFVGFAGEEVKNKVVPVTRICGCFPSDKTLPIGSNFVQDKYLESVADGSRIWDMFIAYTDKVHDMLDMPVKMLHKKSSSDDDVIKKLNSELDSIKSMGFWERFLFVFKGYK